MGLVLLVSIHVLEEQWHGVESNTEENIEANAGRDGRSFVQVGTIHCIVRTMALGGRRKASSKRTCRY